MVVFFILATTFVVLRIWTRLRITERKLLIDDYLAIAGWVDPALLNLTQILLVGTYIPLIISLGPFQKLETAPESISFDDLILIRKVESHF
jgi:hypothetical protein